MFRRWDDSGGSGALEQQLHGAAPFRPEVDGVLVDVEVDMLVHHLFAHLLRMLAHERQARAARGEAYSTLRRSTRLTAFCTSRGSERFTTMPPSGIAAPV